LRVSEDKAQGKIFSPKWEDTKRDGKHKGKRQFGRPRRSMEVKAKVEHHVMKEYCEWRYSSTHS
jgi:hypothetical protein